MTYTALSAGGVERGLNEGLESTQASLGIGEPYLFQSIAAAVVGGVYIATGWPLSAPWLAR
jgi:ribose/xylose/arabinose/galactoside ABC-type transport system permease subunit